VPGGGDGLQSSLADAGLMLPLSRLDRFLIQHDPNHEPIKMEITISRRGSGHHSGIWRILMPLMPLEIEGEPYTRETGPKFDWFRHTVRGTYKPTGENFLCVST